MLNEYIVRGHGEPEETDSAGFRYVKDYNGGKCLSWTYSVQRAQRFTYTEASDVHTRLKQVQTESEIVPAPANADNPQPGSGTVTELRIRSITDDDWTIKPGKSGKFYILRTSDGVFLQGMLALPETVTYVWAEADAHAKEFESLAAAKDYASEALLLQTYRGGEPQLKEDSSANQHVQGRMEHEMSKEMPLSKDELDKLLERMTIAAGFPDFILRDVLRDVLRYVPKTSPLELLNNLMAEFLKNVQHVSFKSSAEMEADIVNGLLDEIQAREGKPFTAGLPIHAGSEEESDAKAVAIALKLRKLLPATIWVFVGPSADKYPTVCVSQGEHLSDVIGVEGGERGVIVLIHDDGSERLEPLITGESWEDCVDRVNPDNDKPLRLWSRAAEEADECESLDAANDLPSEALMLTHCASEPQLQINVGLKIGRNDACPCGSGKKWKKCCMEKQVA